MKIEQWPIGKLIPFAGNARKIPKSAVEKVSASIEAFGWRQPIVVDKENVIIIGHVRRLAARKLKLKTVPVHIAADLSPAQVKALRLMDNRSHDEAQWEPSMLTAEFASLGDLSFDLGLTGFDHDEIFPPAGDPGESSESRSAKASETGGRMTRIEFTEPQVFHLTKLLELTVGAAVSSRATVSYQAALRKFQQSRLVPAASPIGGASVD